MPFNPVDTQIQTFLLFSSIRLKMSRTDVTVGARAFPSAYGSYTDWGFLCEVESLPMYVAAVPSRHYVGRMDCHIYGWSVRQCRTHLGYSRKVKHQTGIFQITTLVDLQGTAHQSMYKSSATTGHSLLTYGISPTFFFWRCQPSGIGDNQEHPAGVNLKKILLHLKNLS